MTKVKLIAGIIILGSVCDAHAWRWSFNRNNVDDRTHNDRVKTGLYVSGGILGCVVLWKAWNWAKVSWWASTDKRNKDHKGPGVPPPVSTKPSSYPNAPIYSSFSSRRPGTIATNAHQSSKPPNLILGPPSPTLLTRKQEVYRQTFGYLPPANWTEAEIVEALKATIPVGSAITKWNK